MNDDINLNNDEPTQPDTETEHDVEVVDESSVVEDETKKLDMNADDAYFTSTKLNDVDYDSAYLKMKQKQKRNRIIIAIVAAIIIVSIAGYFVVGAINKDRNDVFVEGSIPVENLVLTGKMISSADGDKSTVEFDVQLSMTKQLMALEFKAEGDSGAAIVDLNAGIVYFQNGNEWFYIKSIEGFEDLPKITMRSFDFPKINLKTLGNNSKGTFKYESHGNSKSLVLKKSIAIYELVNKFVDTKELSKNEFLKERGVDLAQYEFFLKLINVSKAELKTDSQGMVTGVDLDMVIDVMGNKATFSLSSDLEIVDKLDIKIPTNATEVESPEFPPLP